MCIKTEFWGGHTMKLFKQTLTGLIAVLMILAIPAGMTAQDEALQYSGLQPDECTVNSKIWTLYPPSRDVLTLPRAMYHANSNASSGYAACQRSIAIEVDQRIDMLDPLPIRINGSGESVDAQFMLEGVTDENDGYVVLNAATLPSDAECAIVVYGNYIRIKNIKVIGVRSGMNAICLRGQYPVMDAVEVNSGANGFVAESHVQGMTILPGTSLQAISNYGIQFLNSNILSQNMIVPTDGEIGETDEDGFSAVTGETKTFKLETVGSGPQDWIISNFPVAVQIHEVSRIEDVEPYYLVRGAVINTQDGSTVDNCSAPIYRAVERIQVYQAGGRSRTGAEMEGGFYGYIGDLHVEGYGIGNQSDDKGFFQVRFKIDEATTPSQVIFVPEITGGYVGRPSKVINLTDDNTQMDCERDWADQIGSNPAGTPGDPGSTSGSARFVGYKSVAECKDKRHRTASQCQLAPMNYDSDGDGLKDNEEDLNRNCECEPWETCWYRPDTDNDGITDIHELRCWGPEDAPDGDPCNWTVTACPDSDPADVDGDGYADAVDVDSDNDGRQDYEEDRNHFYVQNAGGTYPVTGLLHRYDSVLSTIRTYNETTGKYEEVECELREMVQVGVRYAWYTVHYESDGVTVAAEPTMVGEGSFPEGGVSEDTAAEMEVLVCRNQMLFSFANFNGEQDIGNIETKKHEPDTDGDGYCDGDNTADRGEGQCPDIAKLNDKCPTVFDRLNDCAVLPCNNDSNQVLFGVNPKYIQFVGGTPSGYRDSGPREGDIDDGSIAGDNIPDVLQVKTDGKIDFEKIGILCYGDIDDDGIPDCVENPTLHGSCSEPDPETGLFFNKRDSDDDGFIDGIKGGDMSDVCPAQPGAHKFVEGRSYDCPVNRVYDRDRTRILSCFLDRDSDGLRDCEEDKNMDGDPDEKVRGIDGIGVTESNPLSVDTDGDSISDLQEVIGWPLPTNPAFADTDEDGLDDNLEDRNFDGVITYFAESLSGEDRCPSMSPDGIPYDTSPLLADTDDDGINDLTEVSGANLVGVDFYNLLDSLDAFAGGGIDVVSNPVSKDSDGDGIFDKDEYGTDGVINYNDSHPCLQDSDDDTVKDDEDGCPLDEIYADAENCSSSAVGADRDRDGMSDRNEARMGTDPNNPDTDGDGLKDGEEDFVSNGIWDVDEHEPNPLDPDTDKDGLNDGLEVRYGTDPTNEDSDNDCIIDGLEDENLNGDYNAGSETDALSPDTDSDGLADGQIGGVGEDLNCNGFRDADADGRWTETDPRLADSDFDGIPDYDEMTTGGYFNLSNVGRASSGHEGCMNVAGSGAAPTSMIYMFGLLLIANRIIARRKKK